uniref:Lipoprotein n=1 Tax=uncultured Mycoplasmataceae bacterium TaxID=300027 RepID=A0A6G9HHY3_9MOLU|nr:hypothetical protein PlMoll_1230 [uncultured Mycoplasmataceae bacterium]
MNKKLFKIAICGIPVVLGCITACSAISSIKTNNTTPSSKPHYSMYDFNSIDDLLNFDAVNYGTFCFDPNTDYTNGNREVYYTNPEEYIPYLNNVTADMFKPENIEKTKDFLAFAILGDCLFSLLCIIYNDHPLPVETFVDFIHNNVKSFSLHINEINNLKLEGKANDGRDTFSFTGGYNANIVAKNYQDNEYHKIQVSVNFNNNKVWFTQFGGVFQEQEIKGILYHYGLLLVDLKSESDQFITSKIKTDDEPEYTTNSDYLQSLGSYPSTLFYQYIKDLQISNNPNA